MKKKLICFGLWGIKPMYCVGALKNIQLARKIYPGWICRFYVDITTDNKIVRELLSEGAEIVTIKTNKHIGRQKQFWRFFGAGDPDMEYFVSRDVDSRLNYREKAAVDEWIASGIPFHIMRDHNLHQTEILGGMWGCVGGLFPNISDIIDKWLEENLTFTEKWTDQIFLRNVIWPMVKDNHIAHASRCFYTNKEKPFIVQLPDKQFVGQQWTEQEQPINP